MAPQPVELVRLQGVGPYPKWVNMSQLQYSYAPSLKRQYYRPAKGEMRGSEGASQPAKGEVREGRRVAS